MKTYSFTPFTPAEIMLLQHETNAKRKDLLKLTLSDLIFKQVLRTQVIAPQGVSASDAKEYTNVLRGKNFDMYRPKAHELVFLDPFLRNRELAILFKQLVKLGFEQSKNDKHFRNLILSSPSLNGLHKKGFWDSISGGFSLTSSGQRVKADVSRELYETGEVMKRSMLTNRSEAMMMLTMLGGSALLVSQMNSDFANTIDTLTQGEMRKQAQMQQSSVGAGGDSASSSGYDSNSDSNSDGNSDGGLWDADGGSWDIFDGSFDSGFDSGAAESGADGGGDGGSDGGSDGGGCSSGCSGGCGGGCS